ncbi:MAG: hypothetical protein F4062_07505 [Acidimicrobiia bacterium]|nr:hypothetical protein [Acidimicrobiia bacterium]
MTGGSGSRGRRHGRTQVPPRRAPRIVRLVAVLAVGALLLSQCGDDEEPTDGDQETTDTTAEVGEAPTTTAFEPPPAPEPLPPVEPSQPAPAPAAAPAPAPAAASPPAPAPSGPPPVAQGVMPDLAIAVDGYAHAVFVQEYFSGPVDGYSATSSDSGVAQAGVRAPDMLIVAPVSNGSASITVTAFGAGGTATQTFTARVGAGPEPVTRPATAAPAPAPAPPAPAPPPPAPDDSDELLPIDDDLPPMPPDTGDAVPTDTLPPAEATEAPTLSGQVPAQTVGIGETITVDVRPYFGGIIQGWAVDTSNSAVVRVEPPPGAGRAVLRGIAAGTATITVTAVNSLGEVAQAFNVTVGASSTTTTSTTTTTTTARSGSTGILVLVGSNPSVAVNVGQSTTLDLSQYFSAAATSFAVDDVPSGVQVSVTGSIATITGVTQGDHTITLVGSNANASIERPARIRVN